MKSKADVFVSQVCKVICFEQEKVARVKAELAMEEHRLPQWTELYSVLGSTTRLKILLMLAQGELCVCDISHVLELTVAATSHQLKLLRAQDWLRMRNDGKMVYYRLHSDGLLTTLEGNLNLLQERLGACRTWGVVARRMKNRG